VSTKRILAVITLAVGIALMLTGVGCWVADIWVPNPTGNQIGVTGIIVFFLGVIGAVAGGIMVDEWSE
jgi:membrane-bound ClpP family serine protease